MVIFNTDMIHLPAVEQSWLGLVLKVPDPVFTRQFYQREKQHMSFPFWSRVWPSAQALSEWLTREPELTRGKTIIELGAGLGLPSMTAASNAAHITATDHIPDAVEWMELNRKGLRLGNMDCRLLDWHRDEIPRADVVLMSDVGYDPADFEQLRSLISIQLRFPTEVLLAVPERSVSAAFISLVQDFPHERTAVTAAGVQVILFRFYGQKLETIR